MPVAYCLIRSDPVYRREAFHAGLKACGYEVSTAEAAPFKPGDALVIWNRYGGGHQLALRAEAAGVPVLVAENGYIWTGGISPHHLKDRPAYALARGWHNDSTVVREGHEDRWSPLGVDLKPWRKDGGHILVCPNRPFGVPWRAMPADWVEDVRNRIRALTTREIRVRPHPGNNPPVRPLADDLAGAWACVIWSSSAGVHALVAGIPVFCEAPFWICRGAAHTRLERINDPVPMVSLRVEALRLLAHAQFSVQEIASGEPFRRLLRTAGQAEVAAGA